MSTEKKEEKKVVAKKDSTEKKVVAKSKVTDKEKKVISNKKRVYDKWVSLGKPSLSKKDEEQYKVVKKLHALTDEGKVQEKTIIIWAKSWKKCDNLPAGA